MAATPDIEFRAVTKAYGDVAAVQGIDLVIPSGAFVALLGPSGCGKTTCLRMIGGFEQPTSGQVLLRGEDMAGTPPFRRPVNMVFQHYALFPHFNVTDNVAYGLRQARPRLSSGEVGSRVDEALAMVRLSGYGRRKIHELSGGQQQRVALARALVNRPAVLLLDEPLAALDRKLRTDMQIELQNLQRDLAITFVLVTHDQEEALSMSDVVCVMNGGRIVQTGKPDEIYDRPADRFVADFVGKTNFLPGIVASSHGGTAEVTLANGSALVARARGALVSGGAVSISIRPEAITVERGASGPFQGVIANRIFLGSVVEYAIAVAGFGTLLATADHKAGQGETLRPGDTVALGFAPGAAQAFPDTDKTMAQHRGASNVETNLS